MRAWLAPTNCRAGVTNCPVMQRNCSSYSRCDGTLAGTLQSAGLAIAWLLLRQQSALSYPTRHKADQALLASLPSWCSLMFGLKYPEIHTRRERGEMEREGGGGGERETFIVRQQSRVKYLTGRRHTRTHTASADCFGGVAVSRRLGAFAAGSRASLGVRPSQVTGGNELPQGDIGHEGRRDLHVGHG